jgi:2-oxoglutarate dehydrogenase E2 component (dihydrolipoamide succinyltransferase)
MPTNVEIPSLGESITEAVLIRWIIADGQRVGANEPVCELETDKANVDLPSPAAGVVHHIAEEGHTVQVGQTIARIDDSAGAVADAPVATKPPPPAAPLSPAAPLPASAGPVPSDQSPSVRRLASESRVDPATVQGTGRGGRVTKQDMQKAIDTAVRPPTPRESESESEPEPLPPAARSLPAIASPQAPAVPATSPKAGGEKLIFDSTGIRRVPMSKMRKAIARRLIEVQQTAAILTTYNEIDLTAVLDLRAKYKQRFTDVHGVNLGLMSFFCRAAVLALAEFPRLNARIDGDEIVYHQFVHLGIAVSTDRGLAVPVLRNAQSLNFARVEAEIKRLAQSTRDGKLGMEELTGGTFTITNGGVYGSLFSTPILNPPQSAILGMHTIQKRPVCVGDRIEARQMMYVALSYDHRLIDGRESVSFLVRIKDMLEDPARLMLEI